MSASGSSAPSHGSRNARCVQPHSVANPTVPARRREPFADETPEIVGIDELGRRYGAPGRADLLARAVSLRLLRPLGEGRFEDASRRLAR
jgi:hypothetical protein